MDAQFKSVEAVNPEAWVEHFKSTVGKTAAWGGEPKLVLLKRGAGQSKQVTSKELPLNVVSPVEQYAQMAQAEVDKTTPKYAAPSVARKSASGEGGGRRRKKRKRKDKTGRKKKRAEGSGKRKSHSKRQGGSSGKRRKTQGDIFG